ncbi:MAG: hypothetical protein WAX69_14740 [Victivallales bacterium]
MDEPILKNKNFIFLPACALLAALTFNLILKVFFRPLWFDEALTVMNFVLLPDPMDIYRYYNIPNNHIVYNILLRFWIDICGHIPFIDRISLRLFTVVTAIASLLFIFWSWGRRFSRETVLIACFCLVLSLPFAIYASAIRGYMLSFLLVLFAIEISLRYKDTGKAVHLLLLFVASFLAVGTMPTNLIAFAAICILLTPSFKLKDILSRRVLLPAIIPVSAFILFYGPISGKLMKAMALNEGWSGGFNASIHFYCAFIISFPPLIVLAILGRKFQKRKTPGSIDIQILAVLLIPLLVFLVKSPSPFPRAFFCMWPVWIFILCQSADPFIKSLNGKFPSLALAFLVCICTAWSLLPLGFSTRLSDKLSIGGQDDFFRPYFMRPDFRPAETVVKSIELADPKTHDRVFIDFAADYPAIMFYSRLLKVDDDFWIFDRPGKKVEALGGMESIYVITRGTGGMESIAGRFNIKSFELAADCGFQKIYKAKLK